MKEASDFSLVEAEKTKGGLLVSESSPIGDHRDDLEVMSATELHDFSET